VREAEGVKKAVSLLATVRKNDEKDGLKTITI
jgi:hypothetical protein